MAQTFQPLGTQGHTPRLLAAGDTGISCPGEAGFWNGILERSIMGFLREGIFLFLFESFDTHPNLVFRERLQIRHGFVSFLRKHFSCKKPGPDSVCGLFANRTE
jgi:hypothetical protein